jgi:hypothetical protein
MLVETARAILRLQRGVRSLLELANVAVDLLERVDERLEELERGARLGFDLAQGLGVRSADDPNPSGQN